MARSQTICADRRGFFNSVQDALANAAGSQRSVAVLLVDLDRFKEVNQAWGHRAGDAVLEETARRLQEMLRERDVLARIGDDEFGLLLPAVIGSDHATLAAAKVCRLMEEAFRVNGLAVRLKASVGIALFPQHGADAERLIQRADAALVAAKRANGGYAVYRNHDGGAQESPLTLEADLRDAIGEGELTLHYQPKIEMKSGQLCGLEALVRWESTKHGFMPPDSFIPLAERTGLIQPLTLWVLNAALRQHMNYAAAGAGLSMAVNLSPRNLHDVDFPELVLRALETWETPPHSLVLEITENAMMQDPARAMGVLRSLNEMGVSLSIDDFGSGYSSLAYLQKLPVSELKIDKAFVREMSKESGDAMIVRSVIELARNFRLAVVAEGVEDQHTWDTLAQLGCDRAQGYFMGRPMPVDALGRWMMGSRWRRELCSSATSAVPPA